MFRFPYDRRLLPLFLILWFGVRIVNDKGRYRQHNQENFVNPLYVAGNSLYTHPK